MPARELLVRKTAGNALEMASFLAVGWSPVWLLAGASDLVGGSKVYLRALVTELQDAGVLAQEEDVSSFEELLSALEGTSGVLADTVDVPPLNVAGVRTSWQELQMQAADLPDAAGLELGNVYIFDYYRRALRIIVEEGLLSFLQRTSTPYLTRAGAHFDPASSTYSERLLRRWADRRSPVERKTTPHTEASDEESAARE